MFKKKHDVNCAYCKFGYVLTNESDCICDKYGLIERKDKATTITVVTAKPGIVVGRGGQGIEELKQEVSKYLGKPVIINVVEVARVDVDALLVAEAVAQQLEKRVAFRRAMKQLCFTSSVYNSCFFC